MADILRQAADFLQYRFSRRIAAFGHTSSKPSFAGLIGESIAGCRRCTEDSPVKPASDDLEFGA
jgi:hypothetical protein